MITAIPSRKGGVRIVYESNTFESILQNMLDRVKSKVNKSEGEPVWDALAPAAIELQLLYIELDRILTETFADTASRENLIRRAAERGMSPKEATCAELRGVFIPFRRRISATRRPRIKVKCGQPEKVQ